MDSSWKLKFRRILFVFEGELPQDVLEVLKRFANDVTPVDLQNYYGLDYLQLPADCMVVDSRIKDFTGVGMVVTTATRRCLPTLVLHDDRPGWEPGCISGPSWVLFDPSTGLDEVRAFLDQVEPLDYENLALRQPWLMQPWTATLAQVKRACALGSVPMH